MNELDTATAKKINALHNDIESLLNQGINKAIEIGELLTAKKTELPHGEFGKWITHNLIFSDRTARRYMQLFENKAKVLESGSISEAYKMLAEPKTDTVSDLKLLERQIIESKWSIGKRILKDIDKFEKPEYGNKRLANLAEDTGNSLDDIKCWIEFARKYPELIDIPGVKV